MPSNLCIPRIRKTLRHCVKSVGRLRCGSRNTFHHTISTQEGNTQEHEKCIHCHIPLKHSNSRSFTF